MKTYNKGKFGGHYDSSAQLRLWHIFKWKLFGKKRPANTAVKALEVVNEAEKLTQKEDFICWLSHASFLIQLGGKRILLDPVFGDIPFYKRKTKAPYSAKELGKIDYLLISHVHYDHFDASSLKQLAGKSLKALLPLKMSALLHKSLPKVATEELDWYEVYDDGSVQITFVPAKHWGRRGLFDKNAVLWGGYVLSTQGMSIYFSGDTAYGDHFKEIGKRFDIDYALLPIGAYKPEFIMKHNHMNPEEAFEAFKDLKAKTLIPMHYGTFKLTDEPLDEPLRWMEKIALSHPGKIKVLKVGEVLDII